MFIRFRLQETPLVQMQPLTIHLKDTTQPSSKRNSTLLKHDSLQPIANQQRTNAVNHGVLLDARRRVLHLLFQQVIHVVAKGLHQHTHSRRRREHKPVVNANRALQVLDRNGAAEQQQRVRRHHRHVVHEQLARVHDHRLRLTRASHTHVNHHRRRVLPLREVDRRRVDEHARAPVPRLRALHLAVDQKAVLLRLRRRLERPSFDRLGVTPRRLVYAVVPHARLLHLDHVRVHSRGDRRLQHVLLRAVLVEHGIVRRVRARQKPDALQLVNKLSA